MIVLEFCDRRGKHNCQGEGIRRAKNDVIVLSDATTFLEKDSVKNLVNSFVDPNIGCVSGLDGIRDTSDGKSGEGAYVKYEMKVRELESRVGSLVGVSGSFFAVRKSLCDIWYPNLSSDFYLPLLIRMRGYRSVLETSAIGYYTVLKDHKMEFRRKVRTIVHGMDVLYNVKKVLNPFRYGFFAIQVLSHKLIRWLVPFCLIFIFISNLFLLERSMLFKLSFALQILFYFAASLGQFAKFKKIFVFKIPLFFVMANYSILVAWYKFAMGEKYVLWDSTKR